MVTHEGCWARVCEATAYVDKGKGALGTAGERGRSGLAALPRVKTCKAHGSARLERRSQCQPWERLTECSRVGPAVNSARRARRSQGYLFQLLVGVLCFANLADRILILAAFLLRLAQAAGAAFLRLETPLGQLGLLALGQQLHRKVHGPTGGASWSRCAPCPIGIAGAGPQHKIAGAVRSIRSRLRAQAVETNETKNRVL